MSTWGTTPSHHRAWARNVKQRDHHRCVQCGYQGTPGRGDLEADHIVPRARGGTYAISNGQTLCIPCHKTKTLNEQRKAARPPKTKVRQAEHHPGILPKPQGATPHPPRPAAL